MIGQSDHDHRNLIYRTRVEIISEIIDSDTGEVVASGDEQEMRQLYRLLKRRGNAQDSSEVQV